MRKVQSFEFRVQSSRNTPYSLLPTPYSQNGFTLIEALISAAILGVVGVILVSLLNQSFQLNNKSQIISKIKQNGQSSLNTIDETVRNAENIICPLPGSDKTILVTFKNGAYTRIFLHNQSGSTNGYIGVQSYSSIQNCDPASLPDSSESRLTDSDPETGLSLINGGFSSPDSKNTIEVKFDLKPGIKAAKSFDNQAVSVHFQTTLNRRNRSN